MFIYGPGRPVVIDWAVDKTRYEAAQSPAQSSNKGKKRSLDEEEEEEEDGEEDEEESDEDGDAPSDRFVTTLMDEITDIETFSHY